MNTGTWLGCAEGLVASTAVIHWAGDSNDVFPKGPIHALRPFVEQAVAGINAHAMGLGPVVLALDNSPALILLILACLVAGKPFCIVSADRGAAFVRDAAGPGGILRPALIVAEDLHVNGLPTVEPGRVLAHSPSPSHARQDEVPPADRLIYLQTTSGSTGTPQCVPISRCMLMSQYRAMIMRAALSGRDRTYCWVPLSHDMGLMTSLFALHSGGELYLSSPAQFKKNPSSWLRNISALGITITSAPPTALRLTSRRRPGHGEYDLTSLRYAWVGAEPVWHDVVQEFARCWQASGLDVNAIKPSYGMAETVVAISCPPATGQLTSSPFPADGNNPILLSNGPPLQGIDLAIWSDEETVLEECQVGRIMVRGDSIAKNYYGRSSDLIRGWRDTGDLGFLKNGEVYIVGRVKDVIIRNGVNHAAERLEETVRQALPRELSRVAAFSVIDHGAGREWFHVAIEARRPREGLREATTAALIREHGVAPDFVHLVERGGIPMTSSGKVRRRALRDAYADHRTAE